MTHVRRSGSHALDRRKYRMSRALTCIAISKKNVGSQRLAQFSCWQTRLLIGHRKKETTASRATVIRKLWWILTFQS